MRYRLPIVAILASLVICPVVAWGQGKVGIINMQNAIFNTQEGQKAFDDLNKKFQPRRDDIQRQNQEIQALQEQIQRQGMTLSDEEQLRLRRELEDKSKLLKRATEDATSDYQNETQDLIQRLGQKMVRIVQEFAQQNGYSLVLEEAQIGRPYFINPEMDLTEEISKRYDAAYPVETAAAATGATTPAPKPASPTPKPAAKPN